MSDAEMVDGVCICCEGRPEGAVAPNPNDGLCEPCKKAWEASAARARAEAELTEGAHALYQFVEGGSCSHGAVGAAPTKVGICGLCNVDIFYGVAHVCGARTGG